MDDPTAELIEGLMNSRTLNEGFGWGADPWLTYLTLALVMFGVLFLFVGIVAGKHSKKAALAGLVGVALLVVAALLVSGAFFIRQPDSEAPPRPESMTPLNCLKCVGAVALAVGLAFLIKG